MSHIEDEIEDEEGVLNRARQRIAELCNVYENAKREKIIWLLTEFVGDLIKALEDGHPEVINKPGIASRIKEIKHCIECLGYAELN
jgi:hypothetical protein